MKITSIRLFVAFILGLFLVGIVGCETVAPVPVPTEIPHRIRIALPSNGNLVEKKTEIVLGKFLLLKMQNHPYPFYTWKLDEYDENILQQTVGTYVEYDDNENPEPGDAGWTFYQFEAVGEGETELKFYQYIPETNDVIYIYTIRVVVSSAK